MILTDSAKQQHRATHTVSVVVKVNGKEVSANPGGLISLSIYREVNKIPSAKLLFSDGSVHQQDFAKSSGNDFVLGGTLEILMGYDQKVDPIFSGLITRQSVKALKGRPFYLEVECKDPFLKSTLVKQSKYFYQQSDDQVIKEIVGGYNSLQTGTLARTNYEHPELVQFYCTDWDFMLKRADANGMCLIVKNGSLNMELPEVKNEADLQVQFGIGASGISLIEFEAELNTTNHFPGVQSATWDENKQELLKEQAGSVSGGNIGGGGIASTVGGQLTSLGESAARDFPNVLYGERSLQLYHGGSLSSQNLNAWATAKQNRGNLSRIKGRVKVRGIEVNPGDTLEIFGIGDRFKGRHFIAGVMHQYTNGSWQTDLQFGWDPSFFAETLTDTITDASGLVGGIRGLQIAKVNKVEPSEQFQQNRIQVGLPVVAENPNGTQSKGVWARLACLNARANKGVVFRPEVGDEVIVGFINNDPNNAVILGALFSQKNPSPNLFEPKDKNGVKGILANQGMQLIFDEEKQSVQIKASEGDNGPMIELDGKNNKIFLKTNDSNSIELTTSKVIVKGNRIELN